MKEVIKFNPQNISHLESLMNNDMFRPAMAISFRSLYRYLIDNEKGSKVIRFYDESYDFILESDESFTIPEA